jgi:hypothetical protein
MADTYCHVGLYETPSKDLELLEFHFSLWQVITGMWVIKKK